MGFGAALHTALRQLLRPEIIVILGDQLPYHPAEIPEEAVGTFSILHHISGYGRQPFFHIVAASAAEFKEHVIGPVREAGFPAVELQIPQATLTQMSFHGRRQHIQIMIIILPGMFAAQFIYLQTGSLEGGSHSSTPGKRGTETKYLPLSVGSAPAQHTARIHLVSKDNGFHGGSRSRSRMFPECGRAYKTGLLHRAVHPRDEMQPVLGQLKRLDSYTFIAKAEETGFDGGEGHIQDIVRCEAYGESYLIQHRHLAPRSTVVATFQDRAQALSLAGIAGAANRDPVHFLFRRELITYPAVSTLEF